MGSQVFDEGLFGRPVSMTNARAMVSEAVLRGGTIQQADAKNAYCQAPLLGAPKWLKLPKSLWRKELVEQGMKNPVTPLVKALYGLTRSSFDWMDYCHHKLANSGWHSLTTSERNIYRKQIPFR